MGRIAAFAVAGLALAYQAFSSFAFEPLLRHLASRWSAEHGGYTLAVDQARWRPWSLTLELRGVALKTAAGAPLFELGALDLDLELESLWQRALVIEALRLDAPRIGLLLRADGSSNWGDFIAAAADPPSPQAPPAEATPPRLQLRQVSLKNGRVSVEDRQFAQALRTEIGPIELQAQALSTLAATPGSHSLRARTDFGATLQVDGQVTLAPLAASGKLALGAVSLEPLWPYLQRFLASAPPQGQASLELGYRVALSSGAPQVQADAIHVALRDLSWRARDAQAPAVALKSLDLAGGRFDLATRTFQVERLAAEGGRLSLQRNERGAVDLLDLLAPSPPSTAPEPAPTPGARPWKLRLAQVALSDFGLRLQDHSFVEPLSLDLGRVDLALRVEAEAGAGAPVLRLDQLGLKLAGASLAGPRGPWLQLTQLELADAALSLAERQVQVGSVRWQGGRLLASRDAAGRLAPLAAPQPRAPAPAPAQPAPAWHYRVGPIQLDGLSVLATDLTVSPPARLELTDLHAQVDGLSDDPAVPLALRVGLRAASGGTLALQGSVTLAGPTADLQLDLADLAVAPAAPYAARGTSLALVGGRIATRGRLQLDGSRFRYAGSAAVRQLKLNERSTMAPLLAWDELSTTQLLLTPDALRIGELRLNGLLGELTIYKDRSVNLAQALKPPQAEGAPAPVAPASAAAPAAAASAPAFAVAVERLRVSGANVDFSDLSLALPFTARIQDLGGQVVGLGSAPDAVAQVELGGRVGEFGEARVAGRLKVFDPTDLMDLRVLFRNVEMTTLTPYSATFAGRRIASGKLSLDLQYRIEKRQLKGENQVLMDQLTLGERIDSPSALDLPLDLALALLKDADGRIDLGLPVSGSLDDPQFSYGRIIWKAITNVLTRIVTAPFRALASLFGGHEDEALDRINFDPGRAVLPPPEREKLQRVAEALGKRPGLALSVKPGVDPEADAAALRMQATRRAVALQAGRVVADDEDAGPVATSEPATRSALEALFTQRFGAPVLAQARQEPNADGKPTLHERLLERLQATQPVDAQALPALGAARAAAVREALLPRGVDAGRIRTEAPAERAAEGGAVAALLTVEASARPPPH